MKRQGIMPPTTKPLAPRPIEFPSRTSIINIITLFFAAYFCCQVAILANQTCKQETIMAELEVVKHTKKVYKIWNSKEHSFWHKAKEFLIEIFIIVFAVSLSIW